jgi:hypothetical protein
MINYIYSLLCFALLLTTVLSSLASTRTTISRVDFAAKSISLNVPADRRLRVCLRGGDGSPDEDDVKESAEFQVLHPFFLAFVISLTSSDPYRIKRLHRPPKRFQSKYCQQPKGMEGLLPMLPRSTAVAADMGEVPLAAAAMTSLTQTQ